MPVLRIVGLVSSLAAVSLSAQAASFKVLHSFCTEADCPDGEQPHQIVLDRFGHLIGPTFTGRGATLKGTLFDIAPKKHKDALEVLHVFCSVVDDQCLDGEFAFAAPTMDAKGNLFGATEDGGPKRGGVVYELTRRGHGYDFSVIYDLCSQKACADGRGSDANFAIDTAGNVYGTTFAGGAHRRGVVFELSPGAQGWTYKLLYDFCSLARCADGREPPNGVTYAGQGRGLPYDGVSPLYGTTREGGANGSGAVYQLTPGEAGWSEKVIHSFSSCRHHGCPGGASPAFYGALQIDGAGNIYGATTGGGANGGGVLYKLTPTESGEWTQTVLHDLCAQTACDFIEGNPVFDAAGNLVGTTSHALYRLDMTGAKPKLKVLHSFESGEGSPEANVVIDDDGTVYGATGSGGTAGMGTVFEYKP